VLKPEYSTRFKKDIKRYQHRQDIIDDLNSVIQLLLKKKWSFERSLITLNTGSSRGQNLMAQPLSLTGHFFEEEKLTSPWKIPWPPPRKIPCPSPRGMP